MTPRPKTIIVQNPKNSKMTRPLKNGTRRTITGTIKYIKKVINKSPKLKNFVRSIVLENMGMPAPAIHQTKYQSWLLKNYPDAIDLLEQEKQAKEFLYKPLISILTPTYNTKYKYLSECIKSVQAQSYKNWEMCLVDDASDDNKVRDFIREQADQDSRIKYKFREINGNISEASNDALSMAAGEFVALLDHDDVFWPNALFEAVKVLNKNKELDFLYSDEDKITDDRWSRQTPFLKPDWNPEFLESVNYITHLAIIRTNIVKKVGGFRTKYNGAQDWDLFFRVTNETTKIHHIPKILYSWRMHETSTAQSTEAKPYVREAQRLAIEDSLKQKNQTNAKVLRGISKDYWTVTYPVAGTPVVSIIIPTKNQAAVLKRCINSIIKKTTYSNYEIILVDTGTNDKRLLSWYGKLARKYKNIKLLKWPEQPFSYSRSCNYGAANCSGNYLLFLNNDTEVLTPNWIELLLSDAQRPNIGAVGCKLYYPDGRRIQHAGIGIGLGGLAANLLSEVQDNRMPPMQHLYANTRHELSAVTAACMMIKKEHFLSVNGFDEKFRVTYNDVDLCLRLKDAGFRTIYNPSVQLLHHESISVSLPGQKTRDNVEFNKAKAMFIKRWAHVIKHDPHLNQNIDRRDALLDC